MFLNNVEKFLIFFKLNFYIYLIKTLNLFSLNYFFFFIKYFFNKQLSNLLKKTNLNLIGFYDNNLYKSIVYHIFANLFIFLKKPKLFFKIKNQHVENEFLYNTYFLSIKIINNKINKKFYKNFFFFLAAFSSLIWYQHCSFFKFYLNFILANNNFNLLPFYGGYFLHVYNV